jgi:protein-tyrosine-phosphatase
MADRPFNVLFPCTGNSARSILPEAILNKIGAGKFQAFSAGSQPKGQVHPETLRLLQSFGFDVTRVRSKSWGEFARPGAPSLDFVFTVCDNAAGEACPFWPGQPMTAHWGIPDPAAAQGSDVEIALAFKDAFRMLSQRIGIFTALPIRARASCRAAAAWHWRGCSIIAMLAVPILIQVYFNSGLAYLLNRAAGEAHCVAAPSALIGASNFFELAVAAAISLFGFNSGAALATVVGVLIEVPVMLSVVKIVNNTRGWYEAGITVRRRSATKKA